MGSIFNISVIFIFTILVIPYGFGRNIIQPRPIGEPITRCIQNGTIAITFDDGPHKNRSGPILDMLSEEGVKSTFFICGANYYNIDEPEIQDLIRRQQNEGHTIGSHTWSHPYLTNLTESNITSQMEMLSDAIWEILGERPVTMRPPFGFYDDNVLKVISGQLGYLTIMWSIDTWDWEHPGDTEAGLIEYKLMMEGTDPALTPGFIALHHDTIPGGLELAIASLNYVRNMGYRPVSLAECLGL